MKALYKNSRCLKSQNADGTRWGVHYFFHDGTKITTTGCLPVQVMVENIELDLQGKWETSKWGRQFKISRCSVVRPRGEAGTKAFLRQVPSWGPKTVNKIWSAFGERCIEKIIEDPECVSDLLSRRIHKDSVFEAAEILEEGLGAAEHKLPLITLFDGIPFPKSLPDAVLGERLPDPVGYTKENPFWLMKFSGVSFGRADELRKKLDLPADMPERLEAAVMYSMEQKNDSVWVKEVNVRAEIANQLQVDNETAFGIINKLLEKEFIDECDGYIGLVKHIKDEKFVSEELIKRSGSKVFWPVPQSGKYKGNKLSGHQNETIKRAYTNGKLSFLLGSPGVGKSFAAGQILRTFPGKVVACAPYGKAASRLNDMFREMEIRTKATTIHKLLGARPSNKGGFRFTVDEIDADLIVVDEISTLNNSLAKALFTATPIDTKILFLGDANQLLPVGRGTILRDWKDWCDNMPGFEYGELKEIHRNSGAITQACADLRAGIVPHIFRCLNPGLSIDPNLQMIPAPSDRAIHKNIVKFIKNLKAGKVVLANGNIANPIYDVQFLVPTNSGSEVGRKELNEFLQKQLNTSMIGDHAIYKTGDKVICLENSTFKEVDSSGKELINSRNFPCMNGEMGTVFKSFENRIVARMDGSSDTLLNIPCGKDSGQFDLGYACTVHKYQGSEVPIVFLVLGSGHKVNMVLCREWLNTGWSRAKDLCLMCGSEGVYQKAAKKVKMWDRKSFMKKWMKEYNAITT